MNPSELLVFALRAYEECLKEDPFPPEHLSVAAKHRLVGITQEQLGAIYEFERGYVRKGLARLSIPIPSGCRSYEPDMLKLVEMLASFGL